MKFMLLSVIENDITDLRKHMAGTPKRPKAGELPVLRTPPRAIGEARRS
jgi:hypothetical protein